MFLFVNTMTSPEAAGLELKDSYGSIYAQKTSDRQLLRHGEVEG